ncbi:MAG: hypothetical protein QXI09_02670 [Candidatus Aenigmatarchaeota archaeon]
MPEEYSRKQLVQRLFSAFEEVMGDFGKNLLIDAFSGAERKWEDVGEGIRNDMKRRFDEKRVNIFYIISYDDLRKIESMLVDEALNRINEGIRGYQSSLDRIKKEIEELKKEGRKLKERWEELERKRDRLTEKEIEEKSRLEAYMTGWARQFARAVIDEYATQRDINDLRTIYGKVKQLRDSNVQSITPYQLDKIFEDVVGYPAKWFTFRPLPFKEEKEEKRKYHLSVLLVGLASSLATLHFVDFSMKGMFLIQPHVSIAYLILSSILLATLLYLIFKKK